jgi:hypothetical protein
MSGASRCTNAGRWFWLALGFALALALVTVGQAQRRSTEYEGLWAGTLTMDGMLGVPEDDVELLSQPIDMEMSVQRRGNVQLFFGADTGQPQWQYPSRLTLLITDLGDNAVIAGQGDRTVYAQSAIDSLVFNLTKVDDDTLQLYWTRVVVEEPLGRNSDRLEWMLGGLTEMHRIDPSESTQF